MGEKGRLRSRAREGRWKGLATENGGLSGREGEGGDSEVERRRDRNRETGRGRNRRNGIESVGERQKHKKY